MSENFNPYESQGAAPPARPSYGGGGGGYQNRSNGGGYGGGGNSYQNKGSGGGYQNRTGGYQNKGAGGGNYGGGGGKPAFQKREYTKEELTALKMPVSCVVTGNENFPDQVALSVGRVVKALEAKGIVVRTGGVNGIDQVVLDNAREAELHIPFRNFNKMEAPSQYNSEPCMELARRYMPELDSLPNVPKAVFGKNPRLILGRYLTAPAQLVIVWSEDGCESPHEVTGRSGLTGHVVKLAAASGIRVINLQRPDAEARALKFVETIYVQEPKQHQQPQADIPPGHPGPVAGPGPVGHPPGGYAVPVGNGGYPSTPPVGSYPPQGPVAQHPPAAGGHPSAPGYAPVASPGYPPNSAPTYDY